MTERIFRVIWNFQSNSNWPELEGIYTPTFTVPETPFSPQAEHLSIQMIIRARKWILRSKKREVDIRLKCQLCIPGYVDTIQNIVLKSGGPSAAALFIDPGKQREWPPASFVVAFLGTSTSSPYCIFYSNYHAKAILRTFPTFQRSICITFDTTTEELDPEPTTDCDETSEKLTINFTGSRVKNWQHGRCLVCKINAHGELHKSTWAFVRNASRAQNEYSLRELLEDIVSDDDPNPKLTCSFDMKTIYSNFDRSIDSPKPLVQLFELKFVTALHHIIPIKLIPNRLIVAGTPLEKVSNEVSTSLEFLSLLEQPLFTDFTLQVETELIPVHRNILATRSAFFKAMFEAEMQEKKDGCAVLKDIEVETVHQLLRFFYGHVLEDLDVDAASRLYSAADRYLVPVLKHHCSSLLADKLTIDNVCDILVLSDTHRDAELKSRALECIFMNEKAILMSERWESLMEDNVKLAAEVMHVLLKGKF